MAEGLPPLEAKQINETNRNLGKKEFKKNKNKTKSICDTACTFIDKDDVDMSSYSFVTGLLTFRLSLTTFFDQGKKCNKVLCDFAYFAQLHPPRTISACLR